jgi:hypothetical protein
MIPLETESGEAELCSESDRDPETTLDAPEDAFRHHRSRHTPGTHIRGNPRAGSYSTHLTLFWILASRAPQSSRKFLYSRVSGRTAYVRGAQASGERGVGEMRNRARRTRISRNEPSFGARRAGISRNEPSFGARRAGNARNEPRLGLPTIPNRAERTQPSGPTITKRAERTQPPGAAMMKRAERTQPPSHESTKRAERTQTRAPTNSKRDERTQPPGHSTAKRDERTQHAKRIRLNQIIRKLEISHQTRSASARLVKGAWGVRESDDRFSPLTSCPRGGPPRTNSHSFGIFASTVVVESSAGRRPGSAIGAFRKSQR